MFSRLFWTYTSVFPFRKARSQQETIKTFQVYFKLQPQHKSELKEGRERKKKQPNKTQLKNTAFELPFFMFSVIVKGLGIPGFD